MPQDEQNEALAATQTSALIAGTAAGPALPMPQDEQNEALVATQTSALIRSSAVGMQQGALSTNAADFGGGIGDVIAIDLQDKFGASNFGRLQFSQGLAVRDVAGDPGHLLLTRPGPQPSPEILADLFLSDALDGEPFKDSGRFALVPTITATEQGFTG